MAKMLLAILAAWVCTDAWPQAVQGPTILARESDNCGAWVSSQNEGHRFWLFGYLSGLNTARGGSLRSSSDALRHVVREEDVVLWMGIYCRNSPQQTLQQAADKLFLELSEK
jgi:hypothetical protein